MVFNMFLSKNTPSTANAEAKIAPILKKRKATCRYDGILEMKRMGTMKNRLSKATKLKGKYFLYLTIHTFIPTNQKKNSRGDHHVA